MSRGPTTDGIYSTAAIAVGSETKHDSIPFMAAKFASILFTQVEQVIPDI